MENAHNISMRSFEEKAPNGKLRKTQANNIKLDNRKAGHGLHCSAFGGI
jgi:hypothetical protein